MYSQTLRPRNDLVLFSIACPECLECFEFDTGPILIAMLSSNASQFCARKFNPIRWLRNAELVSEFLLVYALETGFWKGMASAE